MAKRVKQVSLWAVAFAFLAIFIANYRSYVFADDTITSTSPAETTSSSSTSESNGTHISISPVSEAFELYSNAVYEKSFTVTNGGTDNMEIEVYAAPYSYTYSAEQNSYQLGFSKENSFTQIARWVSFKDLGGDYVENPKFTISPNSSIEIEYRITTPNNIPAGGQYAVIFAHTLTGTTDINGIIAEAAPGIVIYGRSMEGETIDSTEITNLKIEKTEIQSGDSKKAGYRASGIVRNIGNVDVTAAGVLTACTLFGEKVYTTEMMGKSTVSVIPESELEVSDTWADLPSFGIYNLSWTITVGDNAETISSVVFINMMPVLIIAILLLTGIIAWIIIMVRRRKERRSRLII